MVTPARVNCLTIIVQPWIEIICCPLVNMIGIVKIATANAGSMKMGKRDIAKAGKPIPIAPLTIPPKNIIVKTAKKPVD